jgi:uncharacterized membrane protein YhhN
MFADKGELYFIAGLIAFYFHIFYIILFSKQLWSLKKSKIIWIGVTAIALYFNCNDVDFITKSGRLKAPVLFLCTNNFHYVIICSKGF